MGWWSWPSLSSVRWSWYPENRASRKESAGGYAVGWGTFALMNAGSAQGKNRSGLTWLVLSLPLGPSATLLLVGVFEKRPCEPQGPSP